MQRFVMIGRRLAFVNLIVLLFFNADLLYGQSSPFEKIKFTEIGVRSGLSHSNVRCIGQDFKGFLWVGTEDGLNRYDGYNFKIYRKGEGDSGLVKNCINTIYEDRDSTLWVTTRGGGVHYYDRRIDRFVRIDEFGVECDIVSFTEDQQNNLWLAGTRHSMAFAARLDRKTMKWKYYEIFHSYEAIVSIIPESNSSFWIGVRRRGFFHWNFEKNTIEQYKSNENNAKSLVGNNIVKMVKDNRNNLWIATRSGLSKFDVQTRTFTNFIPTRNANSLPVREISDMCLDGDILWIATENGGLSRFNTVNAHFENFMNQAADPTSLSDNSVWSVFKDHQRRIWVGTFSKGLCVIDPLKEKFAELNIPLNNDIVNAIYEDSRKRIWIGTEGGIVMRDNQGVHYFSHHPDQENSLSSDPVLAIYEDSKKRLWFGTWNGGANRFDEASQTFVHYKPNAKQRGSLANPNVYAILESSRTHQMLMASYQGLNVLTNEEKKIFERHPDPQQESNNYIRTLFEDSRGNLWIGSISELNSYDIRTHQRKRNSLGNDSTTFDIFVNCIHEDKAGQLWVATNRGLRLMKDGKYVSNFGTKDGLPSEIVCGILEDETGDLWLSTTKGISKFNPHNRIFTNYDVSDGLLNDEFKPNACFKNNRGLLFFGGQGVNVFNPYKIKQNSFAPPVYFTDFKIFNRSVKVDERDSLLSANIGETREISLPERYNFFSIDFVALNFSAANKNQYAYKLEGFDNEWVQIGNQRTATFTNLEAGTYTFRVKACNNDGLWNETGATLVIHILPAWWKTWWAKLLFCLLIGAMAVEYFEMHVRTIKRQNTKLENLVTERTSDLHSANDELLERENKINVQNATLVRQHEELVAQNHALVESKKQSLDLYAQNIKEKTEVIDRITSELESLKRSAVDQEHIEKFSRILQTNILTDEDWERFKKAFEDVYPNFFASVRLRFPDITASELRLSALIKLNLNNKEAANMLGISAESVKKSRYRLKKRFSLNEQDSLEEFVKGFASLVA